MKRLKLLQHVAGGIAGLGLVLPSGLIAAQPSAAQSGAAISGATAVAARPASSSAALDVALGEGGTLVGQVVDGQGAPLVRTAVTFRSAGSAVARTTTDERGSFSVAGLKGGILEVEAAGGTSAVRVWTASASPPSANKAVLIVAGNPIARGQFFKGPNKTGSIILFGVIVGGVVTAGVIAASLNHSSS
jgi:hypothetical protein